MVQRWSAILPLLVLAAPIAAANVTGTITTEEVIDVTGQGEVAFQTGLVALYLNPSNSAPRPEVFWVNGGSGRLVEYVIEFYFVDSPDGIPDYMHTRYVNESTWNLDDFDMRLTRLGPAPELRIQSNDTVVARASVEPEIRLAASEYNSAPPSKRVGPAHSHAAFYEPPENQVLISKRQVSAEFRGDFRLLIDQLSFQIETSEGLREFAAETRQDSPSAPPMFAKTTLNYFVLHVEQGLVRAADLAAATSMYAPTARADWRGGLLIPHASGTMSADGSPRRLFGESVDLTGQFQAEFSRLRAPQPQPLVAVGLRLDDVPAEAKASRTTSGPFTSWGSLWVVFGVAGVGVGVGGLLLQMHQARAGAQQPARPAASPRRKAPARGSLEALEASYRRQPGRTALALDLGVRYAEKGRHADALPLLLMAIRSYPRTEAPRYHAAVALLNLGRVEEAARHLEYAFRLNPLNVARFVQEAAATPHGRDPTIERVMQRFAREFQEANARGYA